MYRKRVNLRMSGLTCVCLSSSSFSIDLISDRKLQQLAQDVFTETSSLAPHNKCLLKKRDRNPRKPGWFRALAAPANGMEISSRCGAVCERGYKPDTILLKSNAAKANWQEIEEECVWQLLIRRRQIERVAVISCSNRFHRSVVVSFSEWGRERGCGRYAMRHVSMETMRTRSKDL